MRKMSGRPRVRTVDVQRIETPHRAEIKKKIMKVCRDRFMTRGEISKALSININTLRAEYLYHMARSGELRLAKPLGTKFGQAYKARM
jgi:hypothetical protein